MAEPAIADETFEALVARLFGETMPVPDHDPGRLGLHGQNALRPSSDKELLNLCFQGLENGPGGLLLGIRGTECAKEG